jgi:hypothetical protein
LAHGNSNNNSTSWNLSVLPAISGLDDINGGRFDHRNFSSAKLFYFSSEKFGHLSTLSINTNFLLSKSVWPIGTKLSQAIMTFFKFLHTLRTFSIQFGVDNDKQLLNILRYESQKHQQLQNSTSKIKKQQQLSKLSIYLPHQQNNNNSQSTTHSICLFNDGSNNVIDAKLYYRRSYNNDVTNKSIRRARDTLADYNSFGKYLTKITINSNHSYDIGYFLDGFLTSRSSSSKQRENLLQSLKFEGGQLCCSDDDMMKEEEKVSF